MLAIISQLIPILFRVLDFFIKDKARKEALKQKIMQALDEYNRKILDSAKLNEDYKEIRQKYLDSLGK